MLLPARSIPLVSRLFADFADLVSLSHGAGTTRRGGIGVRLGSEFKSTISTFSLLFLFSSISFERSHPSVSGWCRNEHMPSFQRVGLWIETIGGNGGFMRNFDSAVLGRIGFLEMVPGSI